MTTHAHMFDAFLRGDSVSSIAGRYGVDRTVIETGLRARCRELAHDANPDSTSARRQVAERAVALANAGMLELAQRPEASASLVTKKHAVRRLESRARWIAAVVLLDLGWSYNATAKALRCDRSVVNYALDHMPAELRPIIDSVKAALAGGDHV